MLNNITFGKYIPLDSKIHRCHPFIKVFCTFFLILSIVITDSFLLSLVYTCILSLFMYLSRVSLRMYIQSFMKMKYFLLILLLINILFSGSVWNGIFTIWKILLIILSSSIMLYTTSSSEMIYGLKIFAEPLEIFKISSNKIAFSLSLALRFIPILLEQATKIWKSQISRGLYLEGKKIKDKIKSLKSILLPMFILSIKRADTLAETMEVRSFSLTRPRMHYKKRKLKKEEIIIAVIFILQFLIVLGLEVL